MTPPRTSGKTSTKKAARKTAPKKPARKATGKSAPNASSKRAPNKTGLKKTTPRRPRAFAGMDDAERVARMIAVFKEEYPDARCMLDYSSAFELLIATILAAQCTDAMVNQITPELFAKYPTPQAFVDAPAEDIQKMIFKTGFFRNKTRSIQNCCRSLVEDHGGEVPNTMEALTSLGGVGRKTANCVLGNAFGIPGIVVDTHVRRLANRMGFTAESDPDKIEKDLMAIVPKAEWIQFSHWITAHGRTCCTARKPMCDTCPVEHLCPKILD